ncbi:MAG: EAL domain-containing protein [Thiomicrospira sp.]|nr:EAL domain-containing protein [Thiomicrospira sp.]
MTNLRFYQGAELKRYSLYISLDPTEIEAYFVEGEQKFLIYFVLLPSLLVLLVAMLMHRYLVTPLRRLRQFAYYHDRIPPKQRLREIESIRYSMMNTFKRLDNEQRALYRNARTDSLSGLSNRQALQEYLKQTIADSEKTHSEFAFLFLDFDDFKAVNDSLGHDIGDQVIREASNILVSEVRHHDFIARVGGDEFVIILKHYPTIDALGKEISDLQMALKTADLAGEMNIHINTSIGVAFYPKDGDDYLSLMQKADIAMFQAKREGKSRYHFYSELLNDRVQRNIYLDKAMRQAMLNDEYRLFYQPKIDLDTHDIVGAETLIRWIQPDGKIISPVEFIPLAEENGFIVELGHWVLESALKQLQIWQSQCPDFVLSINVATKQLLEEDFLDRFRELMALYEIQPKNVDLEITEYLFLEQNERNTGIIDELRQLGVSISLDDFGTGFSSLSYLKKFYVDQIKIDKAFIDDYQSESGAIFIETIIRMSESLKKHIIAEGVETEQQADYLRQAGCHYAQGFLFSKPLPLADFEAYCQQKKLLCHSPA